MTAPVSAAAESRPDAGIGFLPKVTMGISGNIKTMALAEILQWLGQGNKTGTLVIDGGKVEKKIVFEGGVIISSASTDPKEYLGHFLVSHGYLAEEAVDEAVARQKREKKLLGQILVGMEVISEEDLQQMLRLKSEETIYDIFTWEEGEFNFLDDELPAETMVRMNLDVQWLVLEGSRRKDEWQRIREQVPSPQAVPVLVVDIEGLELDEVDRRILEWIDDDRTVEEISQGSQTSVFLIAQILAEQVKQGHVKVVRARYVEVQPDKKKGGDKDEAAQMPQMVQYPQMPGMMPGQMQMMNPYMMAGYDPPSGAVPIYNPAMGMQGYGHQPSGSVNVSGQTLHFASGGGGGPMPGGPPAAAAVASAPPAGPASGPPASEAEGMIRKADGLIDQGELAEALKTYRKAKDAEGGGKMEDQIKKGEEMVGQALERDGVKLSSVPKLKCSMDELTKLDISPQEGFMLTRVDGSYDIQSILKMSPMPKIEAQILFWRLRKSGHVTI